jgi:FlaA1/EpsC-like NDP-sugar epimerase
LIGKLFFQNKFDIDILPPKIKPKKNVVIFGAGISGLLTKISFETANDGAYDIKFFIDEDEKKIGTFIQGIEVKPFRYIKELIIQNKIDILIISIQNIKIEKIQFVEEICNKNNVSLRIVPKYRSINNNTNSSSELLDFIKLETILGRNKIKNSSENLIDLSDEIVLVTGAAGSIGSQISKDLVETNTKKIILLDQSESGLYDLYNSITEIENKSQIFVEIASIRDYFRLDQIFEKYKPTIVFNVAAYKHVPLLEINQYEALCTNILGSKNVLDLCLQHNVSKSVIVSTDKAVNPTSFMGATKRLIEMYSQLLNKKNKTKFIVTRFGNVIGSNGSVIPLFVNQIRNGGPITLTDPEITRFFMTIPEASKLVLESLYYSDIGDVFVFDMGEQIKIIDLAKKLIDLYSPIGEIEIKIVGLRPGEKLYEEVFSSTETLLETPNPKIKIAQFMNVYDSFEEDVNKLITKINQGKVDECYTLLKKIIPEYKNI